MILEIRVEMEGLGEDGKKQLRDMGEVKSDKISLRDSLSVCGRIYSSKNVSDVALPRHFPHKFFIGP